MNKTRLAAIALVATGLLTTSAYGGQIHVPEDFATIQEAVDSASPGDTVHVVGDYSELVEVKTESITILANESATLTGTFVVLADGVTIKNWHITTDFHNQGLQVANASNVQVKNSTFVSAGAPGDFRGVWLSGCTNCSIENNTFVGHRFDGLGLIGDCSGTQIKNNVSVNSGSAGFRMFPGSTGAHLINNLASGTGCTVIDDLSGTGGHTFRNNRDNCS